MERLKVDSSNLNSVGYDKESKSLDVEFKGGSVYRYFGVPSFLYDDMLVSTSKGSFFHKHIKKNFKCEKQNGTLK